MIHQVFTGYTTSRRDDLESLAYVLIKLRTGRLPWEEILDNYDKGELDSRLVRKVADSKRGPVEEVCRGTFTELEIFLKEVRKLHFREKPDYEEYYALFERALKRLGCESSSSLLTLLD